MGNYGKNNVCYGICKERCLSVKSYQFFSNKNCEYFPCHKVEDEKRFNCMFCYCPLYRTDCPGQPHYLLSANGVKIKDCSDCLFPHVPENYERIMKQLAHTEEILHICTETIYESAWEKVRNIAGLQEMEEMFQPQQEEVARNVYEQNYKNAEIPVLLQEFDKSCIKGNRFQFGTTEVVCNVLEQIPDERIVKGYLYACHAPDRTKEPELLVQYYQVLRS